MSKTDWERVRLMTDEDIDFSDIPPATPEQMAKAIPLGQMFPELVQTQYVVALDEDIAEWAQRMGNDQNLDYEEIVNHILREYITAQESLEDTLRRVIREELHSIAA